LSNHVYFTDLAASSQDAVPKRISQFGAAAEHSSAFPRPASRHQNRRASLCASPDGSRDYRSCMVYLGNTMSAINRSKGSEGGGMSDR
jgi:hypothetical protein